MLSDKLIKQWIKKKCIISGKSDGNGLQFSLAKSGNASFYFRYQYHGQPRKLFLGRYPELSLKDAREQAKRHKTHLAQDKDPKDILRREERRHRSTLNSIFEHYYQTTIVDRYKYPERLLALYQNDIKRVLGHKLINEIDGFHISDLVQAIKRGTRCKPPRPSIANDVLYLLKNLFKHAVKLDLTRHNVALSFTAKDAGGPEHPKDTHLNLEQIKMFFATARSNAPSFTRTNYLASALLFVTCTRKMELLGAPWEEFDLTNQIWHLPAERNKSRRAVDIPLSNEAIIWLNELRVFANGSNWVFPAKKKGVLPHLYPDTLNHAFKKLPLSFSFSPHDIRRTSRTLLSAEIKVSPQIAELCLNHKLPKLQAVYDRYAFFDERAEALQRLSSLLAPLIF
ncbi:integrase arm-type DNA-binding domain-containing protein [Thalassotalea ponticola]|uniref:tyrosine-type recombinase/integrase n=1 Tax=Thalassotalea ponticola TaxID=1523392 RepID=UPI0025B2B3E8|nr:site-specific integrase [Thalassotalea ponticola]MDN3652312.1 integrase arm-type DNA-binding domain-containing protein [Thalassotalea ponticola]